MKIESSKISISETLQEVNPGKENYGAGISRACAGHAPVGSVHVRRVSRPFLCGQLGAGEGVSVLWAARGEPMKKLAAFSIVIALAALLAVLKPERSVQAQLPTQIELPCPAGFYPLNPGGQTINGNTGKFRQWLCADAQGNVFGALAAGSTIGGVVPTPVSVNPLAVNRINASLGTALVAADFALSAGWGSTATKNNIIGTDQAWQMTVLSQGAGIAASPTVTLTFKDGTWTNSPICISKLVGGTGALGTIVSEATTATTYTLNYTLTPSAGLTYQFSAVCMGR